MEVKKIPIPEQSIQTISSLLEKMNRTQITKAKKITLIKAACKIP